MVDRRDTHPLQGAEISGFATTGMTAPNTSTLMRAVDAAFFGAVATVFDRMVKDLDNAHQLPAARADMVKRLDQVRTVHAEMRQRAEDLDGS